MLTILGDTLFIWGFRGGSVVKNPAKWETWVRSLGREDPLEEGMATHSSILAWRISWTEKPGGLQSTGYPRDGGACWAAVYGVAHQRVGHD